jgi:Tol biopolymer transport system component/tRNA A-37 threonylcarbamoyl transferase component Bud32
MIGTTVSHYTILEKLGEGGMGVVYKARDTKLERDVALKFLPSNLSTSGEEQARFLQEAKAAGTLDHPNICTIYSIEEHEGQIFIAMQYVDGQLLRERIKGMSQKQAIEIAIQIADGLAAAHDKGIVHRDIKPENIMVRKDGIVQIMDFGLAKLRGATRLTKQGSTVGTAGYMSPEQVQGHEADHRSDIFSLGVLLYEMLTGQPPFKGVHETAIAYEIVNVDSAPMSSHKPDIPPELDAIVLQCLEKDPGERMQSAKQVAVDLKRIMRESGRQRVSRVTAAQAVKSDGRDSGTSASLRRIFQRFIWTAVIVILILSVAVVFWTGQFGSRPVNGVARFTIRVPEDQEIDILFRPVIDISPDGSCIVYIANNSLYKRRMESLESEVIPGTENGESPFFSPDGKWVGFFAGGKLKKVPLNGGPAIELAEAESNRGGTWTSEGRIVFSPSSRAGLYSIRSDGGEVKQVTVVDTLNNERTHRWPQCLPDGKTVIFTLGTVNSPDYYDDATIMAVNIETGAWKRIMKGAASARYVRPGYLLSVRGGSVFAGAFDADRLEVRGHAVPVIDGVSVDITSGSANYAISDNGTLVFVPGQPNVANRRLALVDRDGAMTVFPLSARPFLGTRISPNGKLVAAAIQNGRESDIWVYDILRNTMNRLTFDGASLSPVWSPDSKRIAYSTSRSGGENSGCRVVIMDASGGGTPESFDLDYDRVYVNSWSGDGEKLVLTVSVPGKGWDLIIVPLVGEPTPRPFLSTKNDETSASLSPDGKWVAYRSNETGLGQVYARPFPSGSGQWQVSPENAYSPEWSSDGKSICYEGREGLMEVPVGGTHSLLVGQPHILLNGYAGLSLEGGAKSFDVVADGNHILITKAMEGQDTRKEITVVLNWFEELRKAVSPDE